MNISTVLLLEDMGANFQVVFELNVEAEPGEDSCLPGSPTEGQCCVTRNLGAESQFGVNSSYLHGVVDLPDGPNMIQTHLSVSRPGYQFGTDVYTRDGDSALRKSGNPTDQPLKMFQFLIGELSFNLSEYIHSLVFQTTVILIQLLPQHPLVPHLLLTYLPLVTPHPPPTLLLLTHILPQLVRPSQAQPLLALAHLIIPSTLTTPTSDTGTSSTPDTDETSSTPTSPSSPPSASTTVSPAAD